MKGVLSSTPFFMVTTPDRRHRLADPLLVALIVGSALLLSHPFTGVRHDGILYAGDALVRLFPGQVTDDLYFHYGSQGRFTVMPAVYAALISAFGLGAGTMVGLLASLSLYLVASAVLVSRVVPKPLRTVCLLSVVLGWVLYGGLRVFAYSEAFLTARSFAEPTVLFALACLLRGRLAVTFLLLAASLAIHPLIGAGGVLVTWAYLTLRDWRWSLLAFAGAAALGLLGWKAGGPFADVFTTYDTQWLALLHEVNPQAFIDAWSPLDYGVIVFTAVVLVFAARLVEDAAIRRFFIAAVIAGLGATLVSFVMVDLVGNPFFGKLQIWRALWVMQWTAMAAFPFVAVTLYRRDEHGRLVALLLVIGWIAPFSMAPGLVAAMACAIELLRKRITVSRGTTRIVAAVAVIAACVIAVQYEARLVKLAVVQGTRWIDILGPGLAMNLILFAGAFVALRYLRANALGLGIAALIFVGSASLWDQRSPWTREIETHPLGTSIWPGVIEPQAKVYWYRDLIAPWIFLGHANYYTAQQGSGAVFSRAMVVELNDRRKITALLDFQEQICRLMNNLNEKATSCEPDVTATTSICTDGGVDYVVLQSSLENAKPVASYATGVLENGYEKKFYLYRCSALTKG